MTSLTPLSYAVRAELFIHLATMEKAGLPTALSFANLRLRGAAQTRVETARKWLGRGKDIATAAQLAGLFSEIETAVIRAATSAGSPARSYARLADNYAKKHRMLSLIKSRLQMPLMVLIVAMFLSHLPALVANAISGARYIWLSLQPLLIIGVGVILGRSVWRWMERGETSSTRTMLENCLSHIPLLGHNYVRSNAHDFFESLALMLEAGMPMFDALPRACQVLHHSGMRRAFEALLPAMQQGQTLTQALRTLPHIGDRQVIELVSTGEASGTLPEMLFRHTNFESEAINHFQQQAADWIPRIVYGILMLWMAYNLLSSKALMPNVPQDL